MEKTIKGRLKTHLIIHGNAVEITINQGIRRTFVSNIAKDFEGRLVELTIKTVEETDETD